MPGLNQGAGHTVCGRHRVKRYGWRKTQSTNNNYTLNNETVDPILHHFRL